MFEIYKTHRKIKIGKYQKILTDFGGREWIRTTEVSDDRFTVCSLWPLGNSPILNYDA